jgi:hypothetical protein
MGPHLSSHIGRSMRTLLPLAAALILPGCATPETRLRTGLIEAGLSKKQSACMAERMVDKLSLGQLLKIRSLGNLRDERVGEVGTKRFLRNVRALQDPEILSVTTRAALGCALD